MIITFSNQATIHLTTVILIAIDAIIRIPFSNVYSLERLNSVVFLRINRLVFDRIYLENGNWKELAVANLSQYCTHYITLLFGLAFYTLTSADIFSILFFILLLRR